MKGLRVTVYTPQGEVRHGGPNVFEGKGRLTIVGIRVGESSWRPLGRQCRVFEADDEAPAAILVQRFLFGYAAWHVEPLQPGQYMASGAYVATSDSRLSEITHIYGALALHDRQEGRA